MKLLAPADVDLPQLAYTSTGKYIYDSAYDLFMDVYTGLLRPGHGAGHDPTELDIQFPLVYMIDSAGTQKAIADFHDPGDPQYDEEFRAAVANVTIAGFVDKTDPCIAHVLSARANLMSVKLRPSGTEVNAVVLVARIKAQNSEIASLGYQVTVLRKHAAKQTLRPSIHVGDPRWDGSYDSIGAILRYGAPQNSP
jgi:hypothetical protein